MNYREKLFNAVGLIEDLEETPIRLELSGLEANDFFKELRLPQTTALELELNGNRLSISHSRMDVSCVVSNKGSKAWFDGKIDYSLAASKALGSGSDLDIDKDNFSL